MGSIPNGSAPLQACARLIFILRYRAAPGRRKFLRYAMDASQCGNDRPGFDMIAVTPKTK